MTRSSLSSERGAILLHVLIGGFVLIGVITWVVDYGVMWVGREQAQNAADAGALAGAVAMAFDTNGWTDRTATGPALQAAHQMALSNLVWSQAPAVDITTDVFFTGAPADRCPLDTNGLTPCIRVNVYRTTERGNALPAIFGLAVGLVSQDVKATATARVAVANSSDCLKPWAIPDKWIEHYPKDTGTWTPSDTYQTTYQSGKLKGQPLPNPDVYIAPTATDPGTGFTVANDLGLELTLKAGSPQDAIAPGVFYPVRIPRYDGISKGGNDYRDNIASCNGIPIELGSTLTTENGNMIGPTSQGVGDLIALDPTATWDAQTKTVINSCAQASTPCAATSPRVVAVPVFNTADYYNGQMTGQTTLTIVNILGFFIDQMQGNNVVGYLTAAPGLTTGSSSINPSSSFLTQIQLVR